MDGSNRTYTVRYKSNSLEVLVLYTQKPTRNHEYPYSNRNEVKK